MLGATCPNTHPFSYNGGDFCCEWAEDLYQQKLGAHSKTCAYGDYIKCPGEGSRGLARHGLAGHGCENYSGVCIFYLTFLVIVKNGLTRYLK